MPSRQPAHRTSGIATLWRWLLGCALLLAGVCAQVPGWAQAPGPAAGAEAAPREMQVFVREGCPHCAHAKDFLATLGPDDLQGARIVLRDVVQDEQARQDLQRLSEAAGVWPPGVPTFVVGDQVRVGFDDAGHTGRELLQLLNQAAAPPRPQDRVDTRVFGTLSATQMGLPLFTLAIGLLDGFNPCATWVLLFLLSLLVRLQDRRRMALIAGTFVLASGAVYCVFMAAWLNVFLVFGLSTPLRLGLAGLALVIGAVNVKDFFVLGRGPSLSIPASAKPGLYERMRAVINSPSLGLALLSVTALALVVNLVELLCTAGFPAVYTAVLTQHELNATSRYAHLGLYILGYMADDALMVGLAVTALRRYKLSEAAGRGLKLLAGSVMLLLGLVLLLRPGWLM